MAVGNSDSSVWYGITNGKISRRFKSPSAKSVSRQTAQGKTVHEELYDFIEGRIRNIEVRKSDNPEFNDQWVVRMDDGTDIFNLTFNFSGGYATAFLKILPNVNPLKPVRITPTATKEGDKMKTGMFINQDNKPLKWFWTKDNKGDLPDLVKGKYKGKDVWDDSDQMAYLLNYVRTVFVPKLTAAPGDTYIAPPYAPASAALTEINRRKQSAVDFPVGDMPDDDLPF